MLKESTPVVSAPTACIAIDVNGSAEPKKKRGRPKKVVEIKSPDKNELMLKKKRGRARKTESAPLVLPITIMSSRNESNYLVMLDIKYSDLDLSQSSVREKSTGVVSRSENLVCDGLIRTFSKLLQEKRDLYDSCPTLQLVHQNLVSPEESTVNFYSNYQQKEIDMKVLPLFELNGESWPTSSTYACWNCDCQFESQPIGIPETISNNQFYCSGNFCSFSCTARYILDTDTTANRFEKISLLTSLYQMAFNLGLDATVPVANPKQTLHKYGGSLSYDQYHSNESRELSLYKLPIIPLYYHLCHENANASGHETGNQSEYTREVISFT